MKAKELRELGSLIIGAMAFGVGLAVLKGNGGGIRDALGNTSAPWLILPFVGGAAVGRKRLPFGATFGLALSLIALVGFYGANTFVLQLGPHTWLTDARLTFDGGRRFFLLALVSGPVFGGLGAYWARTRSLVIPLGVAALFVLEPVAELAEKSSGSTVVWSGEIVIGLVAALIIFRLAAKRAINESEIFR